MKNKMDTLTFGEQMNNWDKCDDCFYGSESKIILCDVGWH